MASPDARPLTPPAAARPKLLFVVTEDWYFVSHRLPLAVAAREAGYDVAIATRVDRHGARIESAGLKIFPVDFDRGGVAPARDLRTLTQLLRLYRAWAPDIVHHVALKPVLYGSIAARMSGVRGIVNALGGLGYVFSSKDFRARVLRRAVRPLMRFALGGRNTRTIVQNSEDQNWLIRSGLAKAQSVRLVRGAGVDLGEFRRANAAAEPPLVILPARLLREKGVAEFVEAARALKREGSKARFALVGQPDPKNPASVSASEIEAWKAEGVVECWGWRDDMGDVYATAQIACLPTYHEGLPKSLLEAAAAGCTIVATDIPGCREIVQHGVTGWTVAPRDVVALTRALREAIGNPSLRLQYGAAARALVGAAFSLDKVIDDTMAIYRELDV